MIMGESSLSWLRVVLVTFHVIVMEDGGTVLSACDAALVVLDELYGL